MPSTPRSEDEILAFLLISTWSVLTGRTLRDAPPEALAADELIDFWADDFPACVVPPAARRCERCMPHGR